MHKAKSAIRVSAVTILIGLVTFGATQITRQTMSSLQEPTPVREEVITEKQKAHSKLFKEGSGKKLSALAANTRATDIAVEIDLPPSPLQYGNPNSLPATTYPHGFLRGIACDADAVVVGTLKDKASQLTEAGDAVFTDFTMTVEEVVKDNSAASISPNSSINVTRLGGAVSLNGKNIRVKVSSFKPFEIGSRYVLFLRYIPATGAYKAFSNGSFQLDGNKVVRLTNRALWDSLASENDVSAFTSEVRAATTNPCGDAKLF